MKKIYLLSIFAVVLGFSLSSTAQNKIKFVWDNPGAVLVIPGSMENDPVDISADATSYDLTYETGSYYLSPGPGYILTKVSMEGVSQNYPVGKNTKYGQICSLFLGTSNKGKTVTVETKKIEDDGVLNIDVVNGSEYFTATLSGTWYDSENVKYSYSRVISLSDEKNEVKYPTAYVSQLALELRKGVVDGISSIKRNGDIIKGNSYISSFEAYIDDLKSGDNIEIQVYEGEAPQIEKCYVTLDFSEGMEDCIYSIRDWKINEFVEPVDGKVEVLKGTDLQLNLSPDYTFTKFLIDGEDVTSSYNAEAGKIRFAVEKDVTVRIEGSPIVYGDVEFTAYVMNPEGVLVTKEVYGGLANALDPEDGTPITTDIELPGNSFTDKVGNVTTFKGDVMTPENTRIFKIKVSEKRPLAYLRPAVGYYISAVWNGSMSEPANYFDYRESGKYYIVAKKIDRYAHADVEVIGDKSVRFQQSMGISNLWGNESHSFSIVKGEQQINFCPELHNPFELVGPSEFLNEENMDKFQVYLDGLKLSPDDNFAYHINFYSEKAPEGEEQQGSQMTVYADGKGTMKVGGVKIDRRDEKPLECFYSPLQRPLSETNASFLAGTPIVIKQPSAGSLVTFDDGLNDEVIFGYNNGEFVNKFTDGEYKFDVKSMKQYNFRVEADPASSGIDEIGAASVAGNGEIYNLQGIAVGKDFESLPAGLYIRGGKKIVKR